MAMIGVWWRRSASCRDVVPAAQELGRRHAGYGVKDEDYATVGAALIGP